ncbi:hypothetical protein SAMN05660226_04140 [Parapedobacter luteus]|uniref:Polysaccharide pyruvyl transferase domain-containing protein n=1 Tax=Parapedobacter luteus TaxID=623280 RepID=A0A1T5FQJ7_9SPHI|nr:polysaccharide pyruvyl transferase family protein [Parapedobacter luteus]SKB98392.1 hypothetical protein SAMN05660226_04140 [Parapedobacter luteus]
MNYYFQIEGDIRNNIGDVLQGMVAIPFLPDNAIVVDRESLAKIPQPGFLIANGWYLHSFENFPPPDNVQPFYVSVHIAKSELLLDRKTRDHFMKYAPIGCRDTKTLKLLLGWGIPAYYSSCLTITTHPRNEINHSGIGECLLVDNIDHPVPMDVKEKLERLLGEKLTRVSHDPPNTSGSLHDYWSNASTHMESLLKRYCKARLVVTTKIHCALPCLGMGANILVIHPNPADPRLDTVREFIEILSYTQIQNAKSLTPSNVNQQALNERKLFLNRLVNKAVKSKKNPIIYDPFYKSIKKQSVRQARIYRLLVKIMYRLGISRGKIKRVYGM